ncbi:retrovirus-related pol polyprotein from transposon TNT 1-94 [Tanacetum coccineum]
MTTLAPQDKWSRDKHIELVNIMGNLGAGMLTRAMANELSAASAHESQGYRQEEGINYDETFARIARLEAIRIFLAFATYINFTIYQIDVKSAFLNGKLKEEVYVQQPLSFESSEFLYHVCKLDKALYGIKQAPRACFPNPKSSHSVEDNRINEPIVQDLNGPPSLQVNVSAKGYPKSVKEARRHPIEQVIYELNKRTLRSETKQA